MLENRCNRGYSCAAIGHKQGLIMTISLNNPPPSSLNFMRVLGCAGLIPFILPIGLIVGELWFGIAFYHEMLPPHFASFMFITYGAVILSFMSGTLWAHGQKINEQYLAKCAVLLSNMFSLSAWCAVLISYVATELAVYSVALLMVGFVSLLWVEHLVGGIGKAYWRLRLSLTIIVVVLHLSMMVII